MCPDAEDGHEKQFKACGFAKVCSQDSEHPSACQGHQGSQHGALSHTGTLVSCASPAASKSQSMWDGHTFSRTFLKALSGKLRFLNRGWGVSMLPAAVTVK